MVVWSFVHISATYTPLAHGILNFRLLYWPRKKTHTHWLNTLGKRVIRENVAMWQCEHNRNNNTKKSGLQIVYSDFIVFITLFTCNAYTWCWICCCWLSFIANNTFIHVYLKKIDRTWANEPSVNESYTKVRNVYIYVYRSINIEKSQRKESHLRQILVAWHNKLHFSLSCYHYYYIESETYSLIWFGFAPFSHDTARQKNETEKRSENEKTEREREAECE